MSNQNDKPTLRRSARNRALKDVPAPSSDSSKPPTTKRSDRYRTLKDMPAPSSDSNTSNTTITKRSDRYRTLKDIPAPSIDTSKTTSITTNEPPLTKQKASLSTQQQKCTFLLNSIGHAAEHRLEDKERRRALKFHPRVEELLKLSTYPVNDRDYNWPRATGVERGMADQCARLRPQHHYQIEYYRSNNPQSEAVMRIWIPSDPDENPNLGNTTHVRTVHNKHRAQIIRMVEDQIENTRKIFKIMRTRGLFGTGADLGDDAWAEEREHHAILSLNLQGIVVCEWQEKFERIEVYFEEPNVKLGMVEVGPGVWI